VGKITIIVVTVFLFIAPLHAQENKQARFSLLMERWGSPGLFLLLSEIILKGEDPVEFNWTMKGAAIKQQLEWLPEEIVSSFNVLLPTALNDNNRPEIHGLIRQAFAKEKMRSILEQEFNEAFDERQAEKVAEWLNTDVAAHVLSAQFEANSFQGIQNAMRYRYKGNKLKRMVAMNKLGAIQRRLHNYWDYDRQYINYAGLVVSTGRVTG